MVVGPEVLGYGVPAWSIDVPGSRRGWRDVNGHRTGPAGSGTLAAYAVQMIVIDTNSNCDLLMLTA
jgi:hypothetical protein